MCLDNTGAKWETAIQGSRKIHWPFPPPHSGFILHEEEKNTEDTGILVCLSLSMDDKANIQRGPAVVTALEGLIHQGQLSLEYLIIDIFLGKQRANAIQL